MTTVLIFERSWRLCEVPKIGRKTSVAPISVGKKPEQPKVRSGNYSVVTSFFGPCENHGVTSPTYSCIQIRTLWSVWVGNQTDTVKTRLGDQVHRVEVDGLCFTWSPRSEKWVTMSLLWDLFCSTSLSRTWRRQQSAFVKSAGDTELRRPNNMLPFREN